MASGIWTAVSGAVAQGHAVDTIANNIANTDTIGFKKDAATFKEYLASVEREPDGAPAPHLPWKDKDFYPLDGKESAQVVVDSTHTQFRQGPLRVTQSPLDVAIDGPGLLEVSTPQGIRFTRSGALKLNAEGKLVTTDGHPILSFQTASGTAQAIQNPGGEAGRFINLAGKPGQISITEQGELYAGSDLVAKLSILEFSDMGKVRKVGGNLYELKDPTVLKDPTRTILRQGMIELSNVNPAEEMVNLIKANRLFETDLKALKTYGELLGKEANEIGKL